MIPWTVLPAMLRRIGIFGGILWTLLILSVTFESFGGADARTIWSSVPVEAGKVIRQAFPVGNGQLGGTLGRKGTGAN
jgi:hypothetical protein